MGFFKTLFTGYKLLIQEINTKHNDLFPRCFSGCGTGLMMIGSAVMAKTAMKDDVQQIISECDAAIAEAEKHIEGEKKPARAKRIFKAKAVKGLKMVKAFKTGIAMEVGGAVVNGVGYKMAENGKHTALKAAGSAMAAFAAYRANVREDLGDEADRRYLTGQRAVKRTEKVNKKTGEITSELEYIQDDDGVTIKKNPNAFRFWFSAETCPSLWSDCRDLVLARLDNVEDNLSLKLWGSDTERTLGHLYLNDQRHEFGGLTPARMDVDEGGIFGKVLDPNIPKHQQRVCLHHRDDREFVEGRTDGCWIIFDCDPEPIIGRIKKKGF